MKTTVVNIRNSPYDICIDRSSKWGNHFIIGKDRTRKQVLYKYAKWIPNQPELMQALHELKGKVLACHCKPKQ